MTLIVSGPPGHEVPRLPRDLLWVARHLAATVRVGWQRSARVGGTAEFSHLRAYRPGDDLAHIDWKASARTDRLLTKVFTMAGADRVLFVLDLSRSMGWGGKLPLLRMAAAVLATLVIEQGDAAGWLVVDAGMRRRLYPVRSGTFHLRGLVAGLARLDATGSADPARLLETAGSVLRRPASVVVVSDFYDDDRMMPVMRQLASAGHEVIAGHVLTPDEQTLPEFGTVEYEDEETGQRVTVDHRVARTQVSKRVAFWRDRLERDVRRMGGDYVQVSTLPALPRALERFLRRREARG